jgi:hypothetical protein
MFTKSFPIPYALERKYERNKREPYCHVVARTRVTIATCGCAPGLGRIHVQWHDDITDKNVCFFLSGHEMSRHGQQTSSGTLACSSSSIHTWLVRKWHRSQSHSAIKKSYFVDLSPRMSTKPLNVAPQPSHNPPQSGTLPPAAGQRRSSQ